MCMVDTVLLTKQTIEKGGVLAQLYFTLDGDNKETLKKIGTGFIQTLLKEKGVVTVFGEIEEPIENDKIFSTSIDVKILTKSFFVLLRICASYSPISVEVKKPNELKIPLSEAHEIIMHISTTTFEYKRHILTKLASKEELEVHKRTLENRIALGEKLLKRDDS